MRAPKSVWGLRVGTYSPNMMNISIMERGLLPSADVMYEALTARDGSFDGLFLVGVKTTGVFCRPTCPARKPRRENVEFFRNATEARRAGYRACLKCRPMEAPGAIPPWATELIRRIETDPGTRISNREVAMLGVSAATVRRYFLGRFGMTFQGYQRSRRLVVAAETVSNPASAGAGRLVRAERVSGFRSESGFRSAFSRMFGMPPGRAQRHGMALLHVTWMPTPLGVMFAGATDRGLCFLEFADRPALLTQTATVARVFGGSHTFVPGETDVLRALKAQLGAYFAGTSFRFDVPLVVRGTEFQETVWRSLREIPAGQTRSYQDIARQIGRPGAVRAVGQANGANRIAILIPCHRVIDASGRLHGYGGGLWRKRYLLDLERAKAASCP